MQSANPGSETLQTQVQDPDVKVEDGHTMPLVQPSLKAESSQSENTQPQMAIKQEDGTAQDSTVSFCQTLPDLQTSPEKKETMVGAGSNDDSIENDLESLVEFVRDFKQCRVKRGFTQADIALTIGVADGCMVSQSTICRFEAMQLSFKSMHKLKPYLEKWVLEPNSTANCDTNVMGRHRKKRTTIKDALKEALESHFLQDQKPSTNDMATLADTLGLHREVVRVWFCNRRQKEKRMNRLQAQ